MTQPTAQQWRVNGREQQHGTILMMKTWMFAIRNNLDTKLSDQKYFLLFIKFWHFGAFLSK